jgi:ubiquinone biosynthesis protein COQ9
MERMKLTFELNKKRDAIVQSALKHVAFDGWSNSALIQGAIDAGFPDNMVLRAFPNGMSEVIDHFADWSDRRMVTVLDSQNLDLLKIRERIHACVKTRLQINALNKEAIRRLLSYFALPMNTPLAAHLAWRSCSVMWYASGDRSADWNHYTKRGLLVSVYSTTLLYWMSDEGNNEGDFPETWAFLDRRISDVLKTFAVPYQLESMLSRFTGPFLSRTVFRS